MNILWIEQFELVPKLNLLFQISGFKNSPAEWTLMGALDNRSLVETVIAENVLAYPYLHRLVVYIQTDRALMILVYVLLLGALH